MKNYLRRKRVNALFLLGVILLFLCQFFLYKQSQHLFERNSLLNHTNVVIEHLDNLRINLLDSLLAVRHYLMTGNDDNITAYNTAFTKVLSEIPKLKNLTADNPMQQILLTNLSKQLQQQNDINQNLLNIYKKSGQGAATKAFISSDFTKNLNLIGDQSKQLKMNELALLSFRTQDAAKATLHTFTFIFLVSCAADILMIILLVYIGIMDKRNFELQQRYNQSLNEKAEKAEEASRLKSLFIANISHELLNPLNGIIGFSELIRDGKLGQVSAEHKEYLNDIYLNSKHLLQMINNLLDLAKLKAGKMAFYPREIDLSHSIKEVISNYESLIIKKNLKIETEISPNLKKIIIDPERLKQVVSNYLSNAIKFTLDGGQITVRAKEMDAYSFRLEIEDTGIGIADPDLERLFMEFQQLDQSQQKKYHGAGIGLAVTKRLVEAQKGSVGARSILNKGSMFYAVFPYTTTA